MSDFPLWFNVATLALAIAGFVTSFRVGPLWYWRTCGAFTTANGVFILMDIIGKGTWGHL